MSVLGGKKKRRTALTTRQKLIIQMLVRMASEPVTVSAISEKLKVSSRTVLREMPVVESWFKENDFHFIRKPGVGLMIDADREQLRLIAELLELEDVIPSFSRQERRRYLLSDLIAAPEPVKAYVFISRYHISEGTLYGDLDALNQWLKDYRISVVRRPGVGISLDGTEMAYRQVIANTAFECLDDNQLIALLAGEREVGSDAELRGLSQLIGFIDRQTVFFVERVLAENEGRLGIKYTDNGFIELVVHLALAICRIREGKYVTMTQEEMNVLQELSAYGAAAEIAAEIERALRLQMTPAEICYITMHLSSARTWPKTGNIENNLQTMNLRRVVMSVVSIVEQMTGLPFRSCSDMIDDLVTHMNTMLTRLEMNLRIENSQDEAIQQNYPEIYAAVEAGCSVLLELLELDEIPQAEIGFISMHFAAAAEKLLETERRIAVVIVCPTGMGTSKMLAANLRRSFHTIEIRRIISAFGIDPKELAEEGIDLILSTVTLNTDFPHLCVSPILQAQDKLLLQNMIDGINKKRVTVKKEHRKQAPMQLEDILAMSRTGEEIGEILENMCIAQVPIVDTHAELIEAAAKVFAQTTEQQLRIAEDIRQREELADTFLPEMGVYLLHCRTKAVEHCRFGYLRLRRAKLIPRGEVLGAVIMLVPEEESPCYAEVISALSVLLVEKDEFLHSLQKGDRETASRLAEQALVRFYENEWKKRMGADWK